MSTISIRNVRGAWQHTHVVGPRVFLTWSSEDGALNSLSLTPDRDAPDDLHLSPEAAAALTVWLTQVKPMMPEELAACLTDALTAAKETP